MRTGRPKKSKTEDDLHGNPGKRKREDFVFNVQDCKFAIPRGLPVKIRKYAKTAAQYLFDNNISKACDQPAFDRLCYHMHVSYNAYKDVIRDGVSIQGYRGEIKKHPSLQVFREHSVIALKYEEQFGLTPLSRSKVKGIPSDPKDSLEDWLNN